MRVLFAATELAPWVKVGGLGDFVGSLPKALRAMGVDARVAIPAHAGIFRRVPPPEPVARASIPHADGEMRAEILRTTLDGVPVYLVSGPPIDPSSVVYTGRMDEEGRRFAFFTLAVLELVRDPAHRPDVLHVNDWHTAIAPWVLGVRRAADPALRPIATLLTIHNLPYTGHGAEGELAAFGVAGSSDPRVPAPLRGAPLALGLASADHLTTVSEGYAREILTPEHGAGFDELLRGRRPALTGILNGLDVERWDPAEDGALAARFRAGDPSPRATCAAALRAELGLAETGPLVAMVGRLVWQKGVDLALAALRMLADRPVRAVILGTGDPSLEAAALELARERPRAVHACIAFDEGLARRIYAGADALLLPSRYEPCGMAQMIAMRYGCVPVARETGGLADTVRDLDLSDVPTGVLFPEATARSLAFAIRRALAARARPEAWRALVENGMREDFSWTRSARAYLSLYERLRAERAKGAAT